MQEKKLLFTTILLMGLHALFAGISPLAAQGLNISPNSIPNGQYGVGYKQSLSASGGQGPYTFAVSSGNLPPGITLSGDGTLSGTPTAIGSWSFTVTATGTDPGKGGGGGNGNGDGNGNSNGDGKGGGKGGGDKGGPATGSHQYTLTITGSALTVTANAQTKTYGTADPALTYVATGFQNGDNAGILTGSLSRSPGENVGSYPITIGSLSAGGRYSIVFSSNNLTITPASQQINWKQSLLAGCNNTTNIQLTATSTAGLPVSYTVGDPSVASISGNTLTLLRPGSTIVTANQAGDANHTAAASVTDSVFYQSSSLVRQHWDDVLIFDNSSGSFVQWQWYKNGQSIPGATGPYYSEAPSLDGQYFVIATNTSGAQIQSCTLSIKPGTTIPNSIKAQPNPISAGASCTVTCNYTVAALQGATLQVLDLQGAVRQQTRSVQLTTPLTMPSAPGIYIISLQLANGQKSTTNVLVQN